MVTTDKEDSVIVVVLLCFSVPSIVVNLFAVISIARNCASTTCTFFICLLSSVEVFHSIACTTLSVYSYYSTHHSLDNNGALCTFYGWLYVAFRSESTLIISALVLDRLSLAWLPTMYLKVWSLFRTRCIVTVTTLVVSITLATVALNGSWYSTVPADGARFHCFYRYSSHYAVPVYVVFHFVQTAWALLVMPCVIARESKVDARLSVLLVGDLAVARKATHVTTVRHQLRSSRLVAAIGCVYHACSLLLPIVLLLHWYNVGYPTVLGTLALQLPNFGALFLPIIYGFMWRPFRMAYFNSLKCCCFVPEAEGREPRTRSMVNPAFRETRDYDTNSIFHTGGLSLHTTSCADNAGPSSHTSHTNHHLPLDPRLLEEVDAPIGDYDTFRPVTSPQPVPRDYSSHARHYYTPSKYQNIFEIIQALSVPRPEDSACSSSSAESSPRDGVTSSVTSASINTAVNLNEVAFMMPERRPDPTTTFRIPTGVAPDQLRETDSNYRLESASSVAMDGTETEGRTAIRFTDLRKVRTENRPEFFNVDSPLGNEQRFRPYISNNNYYS